MNLMEELTKAQHEYNRAYMELQLLIEIKTIKKYSSVYPEKKEDLIGAYKKCFWCKKKMKITEDGIQHWGKNHGNTESLEDLYNIRLFDIKQEKLLFFGDEKAR